ncbi:DUF262 domain-containing protein [Microcoleus sp. FACHB-831]|uniref:GmrSD restriction endonuclease domain-containing protein n=1 Tax=Microcoleus sp. FACHB-831 TaxID=2692827 RepID=UPI0016861FE4|nr:DUF262 domain-containing protein [Microcoleus sp. FACHB-831]MBD1921209.1 DUF262 domain-containing protein [Microcoleus sp. FACHB-831]
MKAPEANPKNLLSLINDVYSGKVVVPEFQRSFVWERDDVEQFLTSLLHGYFTGTFLMLDTPTQKPMFSFRAVEGVEKVNPSVRPKTDHRTVQLVLDGQQRITSLFYALYEPDIPLKNVKNPYIFYLDIEQALNGNIDEAVIGISKKDNKRISEFDKLVLEDKAIRFSVLKEPNSLYKWLYQKQSVWQEENVTKIAKLYERLQQFMIPVVALPEETSQEDIVNIFERINRTGVSLSLFDLAVAQLYLKDIKLRELWDSFKKKHKPITSVVEPEFLLRVIALVEGKEIRRRDLLNAINLEANAFKKRWDEAVECILKAHTRITHTYGAFSDKWIPYSTLLVTLAVVLYKLKDKSAGAEDYGKVDRWYWGCVLSRRYDSSRFTKTYQDVKDIDSWLGGGDPPQWLQQFASQDLNLDIVDDPRSALYRGLMGIIVRQGAKDFLTGQSVKDKLSECQDDHIFPKSTYQKQHKNLINSILNRTIIWERTNNEKKNKAPSEFFQDCLSKHGNDENKLKETLDSHFISPNAYTYLKNDDFNSFIEERRKSLKAAIKDLFP